MSPDESATLTPSHVSSLPILDRMRECSRCPASARRLVGGEWSRKRRLRRPRGRRAMTHASTETLGSRRARSASRSPRWQCCGWWSRVGSTWMPTSTTPCSAWRVPANGAWAATRHAATARQPLGRPDRARVPRLSARGDRCQRFRRCCRASRRPTPRASASTSSPACSSGTPAAGRPSCSCCSRRSRGNPSPT